MIAAHRLLSERYDLTAVLGFGGMAEVHRARDLRLHRDVAVKVLRADLARDPDCYLRFRREAQHAAALNHPAIAAVYDTGSTDGDTGPVPYIVMEYVDGVSLRDLLHADGAMQPARAIEVIGDVCQALHFSHQHGIIHRDVKPANIMISKTGAVKVVDFGIARALADTGNKLTQTAAVIGTAHYLSPEQASGNTVDARSDVYSLGCVLYELITGEPPFAGESPVAVAYQHVREDPAPPSRSHDGISSDLDAVVLKALAKNPDNRYQRAADMRADLIRVQAGEAPKAPKVLALDDPTDPASWPEVTGRRRPKSGSQWLILRWLIAVAALAVLTITITVTVNALGDRSHSVRVPNVHGQTQQDAIAKLQDLGFEILGPNTKPDDSVPDGLVIDTEPRAGMALAGGDAITVNVSSGPEKRTIPSCAKLIANDCVRALATAGFHRVTLWPTDSADVAPNTVITTVPAAGQILAITSDVAVVVSKGPEARRVPDVSGQSIDQATANLRAAGFTIILRAPVDSPLPAGHVVSSDPLPGTALHGMSAITLKVSLGNQFTMPNLAGMTYLEIIPVLQVLGHDGPLLNGGEVPDTDDNRNRVVKQDPLPGSNVNRDGAITLNYGA